MSPQAFTLAGFERVEGVDYAQSWLVTASDLLRRVMQSTNARQA